MRLLVPFGYKSMQEENISYN